MSGAKPLRVHSLGVPKRHWDYQCRRHALIGYLGTWTVAFTLIVLAFGSYIFPWTWYSTTVDYGALAFAACAACIFPLVWWVVVSAEPYRAALMHARLRRRRLSSIVAIPGAIHRVPHRFIEHAFPLRPRTARDDSKRVVRALQRVLPHVVPGTVVVVNGPRLPEALMPVATDRAFEPINADGGDADELIRWNVEYQGIHAEQFMLNDDGAWRLSTSASTSWAPANVDASAKTTGAQILGWLRNLVNGTRLFAAVVFFGLLLAFSGRLIYRAVLGDRAAGLIIFVILLVAMAWFIIRYWVLGRSVWLIPGAVVISAHPVWRSRAVFRRYLAHETPVVLDWPNNRAYVVHKGRVEHFAAGWPMLAAWMSTARSPTREEVECFLGGAKEG
jgi:hypothetical protein